MPCSVYSPPVHDRRLGRIWLAATLFQVAVLVFFAAQYVFGLDGQRCWGVSDDIYISACYARNLAHGAGAVWYPGAAPVEGFSNPLWTLLLALVHALPFFREEQLGLYVLVLQLALVGAIGALAASILRRLLERVGSMELGRGRALALFVLSLSLGTLAFWMAEGFEVGLVLLFGLVALRVALREPFGAREARILGLCAGLALWTRMDGVLACAPAALLVALERRWRPGTLAAAALGFGLPAAALFLVRHAVYGEWLPNTYYLKLAGWPLGDRLRQGLGIDWTMLPGLALCWLGLAFRALRERLGALLRPVLALLATATLLVFYSIHNGGDSWGPWLGYDRFTAPAALFLGLALALALLRLPGRAVVAAALVAAFAPLALDKHVGDLVRLVRGKTERSEPSFAAFGRALEDCSKPEAKVALGPAGAIVYFSHRGAYDSLGKCDAWVARQPVNSPGLSSGHNKRYLDAIFEREDPEFSYKEPPPRFRARYARCLHAGQTLWVRRDAPNALWDKLQKVGE